MTLNQKPKLPTEETLATTDRTGVVDKTEILSVLCARLPTHLAGTEVRTRCAACLARRTVEEPKLVRFAVTEVAAC